LVEARVLSCLKYIPRVLASKILGQIQRLIINGYGNQRD
jgi:hypothetical protein